MSQDSLPKSGVTLIPQGPGGSSKPPNEIEVETHFFAPSLKPRKVSDKLAQIPLSGMS